MISFALITRNSEDTLPDTLRSIKSIADEIIVADTGSTDDTPEIARAFGAQVLSLPEDKYPDKFIQIPTEDGRTQTCLADFAWARNITFEAANEDLIAWVDSDDTIQGLEHWHDLVQTLLASNADGALLPYEYAYDPRGNVSTILWRERLVKAASNWQWVYPIHEVLNPTGKALLTYDKVRVCHQKDRRTSVLKRRNIEILKAKCDPKDPRTMFYLGLEHTHNLEYAEASKQFQAFISVGTNQEELAQAYVYLGDLFRVINQHRASIDYYQKAIMIRPNWRDAYFGLAACCCAIEDWDRCLFFTKQGRDLPEDPNTLLAFNPQHEKLGWSEWATRAYIAKGQLSQALECAVNALQQNPDYEPIRVMHRQLVRQINDRESNRALDEAIEHLLRHDQGREALQTLLLADLPGGPVSAMLRSIGNDIELWKLPGRTKTANLTYELVPDGRLNWLIQELQHFPVIAEMFIPGTGDGYLARSLAISTAIALTCTEPDLDLIRQFWGKFTVKQAEAGFGPKDNTDAVLLSGVLEHLHNPQFYANMVRGWLKENGHLFVIVPNGPKHPYGPPPSIENLRVSAFTPDRLRHYLMTDALPQHVPADGTENGYLCHHVRIGKPKCSPRSIGIYCPPALETWGPFSLDKGIGGSEEAVIYLSRELARRGHEVVVYNDWEGSDGPVSYQRRETWRRHDLCVGWRYPEIFTQRNPPASEWRWLWLHDTIDTERVYAASDRIDQILVGSHFHQMLYPKVAPMTKVIRYGVVPEDFPFVPDAERKLTKFVYTSCPTRGLESLLDAWAEMRQRIPGCELHVFYDFINVNLTLKISGDSPEMQQMAEIKHRILEKSKQPGVFWRGRVGQRVIAEEMRTSGIFCYPCKFPEIMGISAAKAEAAGCWPVYYPVAALPETIAFGTATTPERMTLDSTRTTTHVTEQDRREMSEWAKTVYSWERVADHWERLMLEG